MAWEFDMVAGPFNPRLTEGPAWDGTALLFTHIPASRESPWSGGKDLPKHYWHTHDPFVALSFAADVAANGLGFTFSNAEVVVIGG